VTLNSFVIAERTGSYTYSINYTLANNTSDREIPEGTFKLFGPTEAEQQYGFFSRMFPGDTTTRSYTFEALKTVEFDVLQYHDDHFFSSAPFEEYLKWEVIY